MRISAQRRQLQSRLHRLECKRVDLDRIEEIFAALLAREEVVDPGKKRVSAEFQVIASAIDADAFSQVSPMLARLARKQVRPPYAIEDVGNFDQHIAGVAVRLLLIARELCPQVADHSW